MLTKASENYIIVFVNVYFREDNMKRSRFIILTACILLMILALASCKNGNGADTQAETEYFTVTFDTQGGSEIEAMRIAKGGKIKEPTAPERDGYVFDGWSFNSADWVFEADTVTSDMTLIAKWINADTIYNIEALDNGVMITEVKRTFDTMTVPSVIGGRPVIAIGDSVFAQFSVDNVQKITVAESVKSVGSNAFKECADIEIVIKGALTEIGEYAFYGCNMLSSVSFGEGLKTIPPQAFSGCSALTELVLPKSLELIDENAFEDCSSVVTVIMHETTKSISDGAFLGMDSLKAIYFYGTQNSFDTIEFADGNDSFTDVAEDDMYFYSETEPTSSGKYWYFNDKGKIRIWK